MTREEILECLREIELAPEQEHLRTSTLEFAATCNDTDLAQTEAALVTYAETIAKNIAEWRAKFADLRTEFHRKREEVEHGMDLASVRDLFSIMV